MPKVERITGGAHDLRITRRRRRQRSERGFESARIRVKCGCCNEAVEICHDEDFVSVIGNTLEINGVMGTIAQWRQVFAPLLGFRPVITSSGGVSKTTWESRI